MLYEVITPDGKVIYLKIDYFKHVIDSETGSDAGISFDRSCLYPLSVSDGAYGDYVELPSYSGTDRDTLGTRITSYNVCYTKLLRGANGIRSS